MLTCCGVEGAGVEPGEAQRLLGGVEAGARHHDLGDPRLPRPLDHGVQVPRELLVGEVGADVHDDVVTELLHHPRRLRHPAVRLAGPRPRPRAQHAGRCRHSWARRLLKVGTIKFV